MEHKLLKVYWVWPYILGGFAFLFFFVLSILASSSPPACHCDEQSAGHYDTTALTLDNAHLAHPDAYSQLYNYTLQTCGVGQRNIVLQRGDGTYLENTIRLRPWSLNSESYHAISNLSLCNTPEDLLQSLKLGERKAAETENGRTYFRPHGCNYKWYTTSQMCEVASRYDAIYIVGDSYSRHLTQALFMLLSGDLVYGGLPRLSQDELYDSCVCDGQFSENVVCRTYNRDSMFEMRNSHAYGVCPLHRKFQVHFQDSGSNFSSLCSPDPRPRLVLIQAGPHTLVDIPRTVAEFVTPAMEALMSNISACEYNASVKVVWTGMNSQNPSLDGRYPWQTDANSVVFNEGMAQHALETYGIQTLDFINLTRRAEVSDGLHYLSEVNVLKAMYLHNLMDLWS